MIQFLNRICRPPLAIGAMVVFAAVQSSAVPAPEYWDTSNSGGLSAGSGTWSISGGSNKNWSTALSGTGLQLWTNGDDAFFETNGTSAITISGPVQVNSMTFNGTGYSIGGTALTLTGSNITTNVSASISAVLDGTVGLTKQGAARLTLNGASANTFTGATAILDGTLSAGAGALSTTSDVSINTGGTLLLSGAGAINRVNNSAGINLAGGTLSTSGLTGAAEALGSLTLSGNSTIDFGAGTGDTLTFASLASHTAGTTLKILGWSGTPYTSGSDRLIFGGSAASFNGAFAQSDVTFDGFGAGFKAIDLGGSTFEIVAVPEPATVLVTLALVGLIGLRERRLVTELLRPRRRARAVAGRR